MKLPYWAEVIMWIGGLMLVGGLIITMLVVLVSGIWTSLQTWGTTTYSYVDRSGNEGVADHCYTNRYGALICTVRETGWTGVVESYEKNPRHD